MPSSSFYDPGAPDPDQFPFQYAGRSARVCTGCFFCSLAFLCIVARPGRPEENERQAVQSLVYAVLALLLQSMLSTFVLAY